MKKRMIDKLKHTCGETISEVLVALLISSLALVMLASMITSTSKMVTTSKSKMDEYYTANTELESLTAASDPKAVKVNDLTVSITGERLNDFVASSGLTCYQNNRLGKPVYAYDIP
ncbi:MAG: hypothetical protein IJI45_01065 [Anaerolineaceae bacterium]|nr:hypothetical protein [Anaerolineaceae bacterium]